MDPGRLWRIASLLAQVFIWSGAAWGQELRILVQDSPLAGFRYYAAAHVWRELRVGDRLELAREHANPHDANAVVVLWRGHKLGYVPRRDNAALAWGLDRGAPLRARISALTEHANPARRVRFEVYVE
jgi:hypothetical protein